MSKIVDQIQQEIAKEFGHNNVSSYLLSISDNPSKEDFKNELRSILSAQPAVTDKYLGSLLCAFYYGYSRNPHDETVQKHVDVLRSTLSAQGEEKKPDGWITRLNVFIENKGQNPDHYSKMKPVYFSPISAPFQKKPLEETGWISVDDRLPEKEGNYFVFVEGFDDENNRYIRGGYHHFVNTFQGKYFSSLPKNEFATHWIELSAPTATGKEGKDEK